MSARLDLSCLAGNVLVRITTDKQRAECVLTPIELLGLASAAREYGMKALHAHVSQHVDGISRPLTAEQMGDVSK